jgi:ABC-2 type transport system ATP-binding protein
VEKVCTHVAILKKGELLAAGHVDEVLVNEDIIEISASDLTKLEQVITGYGGYSHIKHSDNGLQVFYPVGTAKLEAMNQHCFNNGVVLNHLQLKKKSLESKFFELTGTQSDR